LKEQGRRFEPVEGAFKEIWINRSSREGDFTEIACSSLIEGAVQGVISIEGEFHFVGGFWWVILLHYIFDVILGLCVSFRWWVILLHSIFCCRGRVVHFRFGMGMFCCWV